MLSTLRERSTLCEMSTSSYPEENDWLESMGQSYYLLGEPSGAAELCRTEKRTSQTSTVLCHNLPPL